MLDFFLSLSSSIPNSRIFHINEAIQWMNEQSIQNRLLTWASPRPSSIISSDFLTIWCFSSTSGVGVTWEETSCRLLNMELCSVFKASKPCTTVLVLTISSSWLITVILPIVSIFLLEHEKHHNSIHPWRQEKNLRFIRTTNTYLLPLTRLNINRK